MFKQTKRIISMVLCLALVLSVFGMIGTQSVYAAFSDTRGHWAESVIDKWSAKGVLSGDGDGTFRPDDSITRAEFAKVIVTAKGYSNATGISYTDVPKNAWYYSYLTLAAAAGIIKGYEDGSFRPEAQITREEACAVISRAYVISDGRGGSFTDSAQISDWARTYVSQLSANNIIRGYEDGSFRPKNPITRAETVQILDRVSSDESLPTLVPDNSEGIPTAAPDTSSMFGSGFSSGFSGSPSGNRSTPKPSTSEYTVTFDSNGGSEVPTQKIRQGKNVEEPEEPSKDGYVFVGWLDKNSNYFEFDETVAEDITLKADWVKEINATEEEINELISKNISGEETIDIDNDSIVNVTVDYELDNSGTVGISPLKSDPVNSIAGLIGTPIEIDSCGGNVVEANITFKYDPDKINGSDPNDLAIVWFDEENNITTLLEDSIVDTENNTVSVKTNHFSKYGVVLRQLWDAAWNKQLPAVRTDDTPYYNVILAMDCSGSMKGEKIQKSIEAAQKLVDILTNDDYISLLAFASGTKEIMTPTPISSISENGDRIDNRNDIKNKISTLNASGGTNIESALNYAINYNSDNSKYQSLVILLSDGQSSVSDQVLQQLRDNKQKVITVGIGADVKQTLMEKISNATDGSYIYCENASDLADAFIDLQNAYIGSTVDTDGDGLPDLVEKTGMRDQYGEIWITDPNTADSDGDGYSDGEEMGNYNAFAIHPYFKRISRPDFYSVKSDETYLFMPENLQNCYTIDNKLKLTVVVSDYRYRKVPDEITPIEEDGIPKEYIYSAAKNLQATLTNIPNGFSLEKIDINSKNSDNGYGVDYEITATLSYMVDAYFDAVTWNITADNCSDWSGYMSVGKKVKYVEKSQPIHNNPQTTNSYMDDAEMNMATLAKKISESIYNNGNEKAKTSESIISARESFKNQMTKPNNALPDEVYDALATDIMNNISTGIDKYETNPNKLAEQIYNALNNTTKTNTLKVKVGNSIYTINYTIMSAFGIGDAFITITGGGKPKENLGWTNANSSDGINALASYCASLAQLNTDLWKDFMAYYVSDTFGLIGIKKITKDNVRSVLDKSEKVIRAICDKNDANKLIEEMGDSVKEKLKSGFTNQFKKYIKENIPNGENIVKAADKYNNLKKKYEKFVTEWNRDAGSDKTTKAYEQFKSLYENIEPLINNL